MRFPLLIDLQGKKYIIKSKNDLPIGVEFTILRTNFARNDITLEDVTYRRKDEESQEDNRSLELDCSRPDSGGGSEDSGGSSVQEGNSISGDGSQAESSVSEEIRQE